MKSLIKSKILSVQLLKLREVAELRWDGANERIPGENSESATMKSGER